MAGDKRDVLLIGARKPVLTKGLESKVNLHYLLEAKDQDAFIKEVGPKISAIALAHGHLKIDGGFVRGIAVSPGELAFLRLINELGHLTGKRTVAESVESESVLARLREIGVDFAQGYHLGRPGPIEERVAANDSGEVPILKLAEI